MRFLISRLSSLGDVACSLPAAGALKAAYPQAEVVWVVDPRFAGVVECCRHVDTVLSAKPGVQPRTWLRPEGEFDAALDLQGLLKSAILVARSRAKQKLGYHWQREGSWLFSRPVRPDPTSFHIVDQYVDAARAAISAVGRADIPERADFGLESRPDDVLTVKKKIEERGVSGRFVAMNAGAGWATKRWPAAHLAILSDKLRIEGYSTLLIGGKAPGDMEAADDVIRLAKEPIVSMLGETSVRELIALLSLAEAHVGGDTGSTHLTAALGRPAIGLYSITRPKRSCPYGQVDRCRYEPAGLSLIRPEAVLESVMGALK